MKAEQHWESIKYIYKVVFSDSDMKETKNPLWRTWTIRRWAWKWSPVSEFCEEDRKWAAALANSVALRNMSAMRLCFRCSLPFFFLWTLIFFNFDIVFFFFFLLSSLFYRFRGIYDDAITCFPFSYPFYFLTNLNSERCYRYKWTAAVTIPARNLYI